MLRLNVGRVSIPTLTATEIVPARVGRKELRLLGVGGTSVSGIGLGPDDTVTINDSYLPPVQPSVEYVLTGVEDAVYGVYQAGTGPKTVQFLEIYDDGM